MANKDQKLKPAYSVNLEELIREQGITKKELAVRIHTTPQTISKACNGVRLTKGMAESIIALYPQYNIAWLLGYSTIKLRSDAERIFFERAAEHQKARQHTETFFDTIARLACDLGYETYFNGAALTVEPTEELSEQGYKAVTLSFKNKNLLDLQEDIASLIKYRMEIVIKRGY